MGDSYRKNAKYDQFFHPRCKKAYKLRFRSLGLLFAQKERLLIGQPPSLDRPFSKAFATYPKSLKPRQVLSPKSTYPKLQTPVLSERIEIICQTVTLHFYHGVPQGGNDAGLTFLFFTTRIYFFVYFRKHNISTLLICIFELLVHISPGATSIVTRIEKS